MLYDMTRTALFSPERQPPLFAAGDTWSEHARLAELARLAYLPFESDPAARASLDLALATMGYPTVATFAASDDGQAFGAVSADGKALVVAFRGTQSRSLKDFVTDAKFVPRSWRGAGRVHSGFADSFDSLFPPIEAWTQRHPDARDVVVTGHSLGAALATLAAAALPHARLVTFGSPRVGDAAFAASLNGRSVARYVDCSDIVATVPPAPYVHVDGLHYIYVNGDVADTPPPALAIRGDQMLATFTYGLRHGFGRDNLLVRNLADHSPINYLGALVGNRRGP